jgi:DnaK suppressor protein
MGVDQLRYFKSRLLELKGELTVSREMLQFVHSATADAADPCDRATGEESIALTQSHLTRVERQIVEVNAAISRIDSGDYGWCRETGEMIGLKRLLAFPTARLSVEAQRRHEGARK